MARSVCGNARGVPRDKAAIPLTTNMLQNAMRPQNHQMPHRQWTFLAADGDIIGSDAVFAEAARMGLRDS